MSFLLNRGGAGKSLTRAETAAEISSLISRNIALLRSYDELAGHLASEGPEAASVQTLAKGHRVDIAKLSEIVLSNMGVPPREAEPVGGNDLGSLVRNLADGERSLREELENQLTKKHHRRTVAVLETQLANAEERIGILQDLARQHSVPVS
jgi:hypothetical protein